MVVLLKRRWAGNKVYVNLDMDKDLYDKLIAYMVKINDNNRSRVIRDLLQASLTPAGN